MLNIVCLGNVCVVTNQMMHLQDLNMTPLVIRATSESEQRFQAFGAFLEALWSF